jgi:YD repeat-containing protein
MCYHPGTNQPATRTTPAGTTHTTWIPDGQPGAGRLATITDPLGHTTHHAYNLRGQPTRTWGTATYPAETLYCPAFGERTGLRTFRDPQLDFSTTEWPAAADAAAADLTQWHHQPASGLLTSKEDASGKETTYTYNEKDLLHTRTWARSQAAHPGSPITTTHTYNGAGIHLTTTHNDGTPSVVRTLDRRGLPTTITDAVGTRTLEHNTAGQLISETIDTGPLAGIEILSPYDAHHRLENISIPGHLSHTHQYHPDHGRLETTTDGTHTITTTYHTGSDLIHTHDFKENTHNRLTTTRTHDAANRLRTIASATPSAVATAFTYQYDAASRRTRATMEDGTAWHYGYNPRGEVTSAERRRANSNPFPGQQFGFSFDGLGNRLQTITNGRTANHTPNNLNQYDQREVPPFRDVRGTAHPAANYNNKSTSNNDKKI